MMLASTCFRLIPSRNDTAISAFSCYGTASRYCLVARSDEHDDMINFYSSPLMGGLICMCTMNFSKANYWLVLMVPYFSEIPLSPSMWQRTYIEFINPILFLISMNY